MAANQLTPQLSMQDAAFPDQVRQILTVRFGNEVHVSREDGERRVSGYLVSHEFEGLEPLERQDKVWDVLTQELGADAQGVSIILTYTPHEYEIMSAAK